MDLGTEFDVTREHGHRRSNREVLASVARVTLTRYREKQRNFKSPTDPKAKRRTTSDKLSSWFCVVCAHDSHADDRDVHGECARNSIKVPRGFIVKVGLRPRAVLGSLQGPPGVPPSPLSVRRNVPTSEGGT